MTDYDLPGFPPLHAALAEHFSQKQVAEIAATGISKNLWTRRKTGAGRDSGGRMSEFLASISGLGLADAGMAIWASMALLAVLAFILGFALNHGSICTVIATAELVSERRSARSIALVECAVWAALVYAILETSPTMQQGWSPLGYLVPGAMLFGIGAYVNGACVFGSVGHFGNGHIDFGLTFLAIFAVFYIESLFGLLPDQPPIRASLPLGPVLLAIALVAILALRLSVSLKSESNFRRLTLAMGAIGITFTILAVLTPRFSVTTSVGSIVSVPVAGAVTSVCMFGGSLVSARFRQRRFTLEWPTIENIVRRTLGGILMGLGALLIPGGNDTLLMIGFPMGAWQAALAYVLLVASVAALIAKFGSMARSWS